MDEDINKPYLYLCINYQLSNVSLSCLAFGVLSGCGSRKEDLSNGSKSAIFKEPIPGISMDWNLEGMMHR